MFFVSFLNGSLIVGSAIVLSPLFDAGSSYTKRHRQVNALNLR
jgi:hypothetical protein